jgi:hypothetical protein
MNYKKHMQVLAGIALIGFVVLWIAPDIGVAIFLPALGALVGARKAMTKGAAQPKPVLWSVFFGLVGIGLVIRLMAPDENFGGFEASPDSLGLFFAYQSILALVFPLFGFLAYLQRVGRSSGN